MNSTDANNLPILSAISANTGVDDVGAKEPHEEERELIVAELALTLCSDDCVVLSERAAQIGSINLQRVCLERAVALDRDNQAALIGLAALNLDQGELSSAAILLEESARVAALPEAFDAARRDLFEQFRARPEAVGYLQFTDRAATLPAERRLTIVIITNLFPPQELGGYGRMIWEFAEGLSARGHSIRVLTANMPEFAKSPTPEESALERHVLRTLQLAGHWERGHGVLLEDQSEILRRLRENAAQIRAAISKLQPDFILAGNLDFLGATILQQALERNIPVLHALANASPGYTPSDQPTQSHYWVAPCSDWNGKVFQQKGYNPSRMETLYPGARIDRFFRLFLPETARLRICYASLVLPYKGADTLIHALGRLHAAGIDFTAEIAGDAPQSEFLAELKTYTVVHGFAFKVKFTGFLDRPALSALFARSNVLVFPSRFEEPFGISQVEALAAGLVVVSSGTGGAKEIIRNGVDGLLFNAGDDAHLAAKLTKLAGDPVLAAQLQRGGQSRATTFSVTKAVQKIEALAAEMICQAKEVEKWSLDFSWANCPN